MGTGARARQAPAKATSDNQERREEILRQAALDFAEQSYERSTMRSIGQRVGIDAATIYYYFPSKEDLLVTILEQGVSFLLAELNAAVADSDDLEESLRRAVLAHIEVAVNTPYQLLYDLCFNYLPAESQKGVRAKRDDIDHFWSDLLARCSDAGIVAGDDLFLLRVIAISAMNSVYRWYRPDGPLDLSDVAGGLVRMVAKRDP